MKAKPTLAVLFSVWTFGAADAFDLTTDQGQTFKDAHIRDVTSEGLRITVAKKTVVIDFRDLPRSLQDYLQYDAQKGRSDPQSAARGAYYAWNQRTPADQMAVKNAISQIDFSIEKKQKRDKAAEDHMAAVETTSREAIRQHPDLAAKDSPLNKLFVERYREITASNPDYIAASDWPIRLADECATTLKLRTDAHTSSDRQSSESAKQGVVNTPSSGSNQEPTFWQRHKEQIEVGGIALFLHVLDRAIEKH